MDAAQATTHYEAFGAREGRICSTIHNRPAFLALISPRDPLLEIGPFTRPAFSRPQHNVQYLDAFSTEELRAKAASMPEGATGVPTIDHVWRGERYAELIQDRFQAIFSAHNIEHQPDLISHFHQLDEILLPGGYLFFAIPDRRYCFDHFLPDTNYADLFGAFYDKRQTHTAASVFEHRLLTTHNDAARHWRGDHGERPLDRPITPELLAAIEETVARMEASPGYIDTHAWQFTPESFRALVTLLSAARKIPFEIERIYPTVLDSNEFYAVLKRTTSTAPIRPHPP